MYFQEPQIGKYQTCKRIERIAVFNFEHCALSNEFNFANNQTCLSWSFPFRGLQICAQNVQTLYNTTKYLYLCQCCWSWGISIMLRLMKVMVMTMLSKGRAPTNSQTLGAASCSREKYKRVETVHSGCHKDWVQNKHQKKCWKHAIWSWAEGIKKTLKRDLWYYSYRGLAGLGNNRVIKTLQASGKWAHCNYHVDYGAHEK